MAKFNLRNKQQQEELDKLDTHPNSMESDNDYTGHDETESVFVEYEDVFASNNPKKTSNSGQTKQTTLLRKILTLSGYFIGGAILMVLIIGLINREEAPKLEEVDNIPLGGVTTKPLTEDEEGVDKEFPSTDATDATTTKPNTDTTQGVLGSLEGSIGVVGEEEKPVVGGEETEEVLAEKGLTKYENEYFDLEVTVPSNWYVNETTDKTFNDMKKYLTNTKKYVNLMDDELDTKLSVLEISNNKDITINLDIYPRGELDLFNVIPDYLEVEAETLELLGNNILDYDRFIPILTEYEYDDFGTLVYGVQVVVEYYNEIIVFHMKDETNSFETNDANKEALINVVKSLDMNYARWFNEVQ